MRISLNWLQDYIDIDDIGVEKLADKLDLTGTEVENIHKEGSGLDKVIVAEIQKIKPHPKADRLSLCEVSIGKETVSIVCGAKNIKEKDKVPLALPGACLPGGMVIEATVIRGEKSVGMLASAAELGLGEDASGIMILDEKLSAGSMIASALDLNDTVLELEITPNRPDLMSMIGMAREIGAIFGRGYKTEKIQIKETSKQTKDLVDIKVEDKELCPRYVGKIIGDLIVGRSPQWMQKRLIAAGARPINNLVDITNYVLFETGQPLHAFDYELLEGGKIIVRRAKENEKITTLDDEERKLTKKNLVIADEKMAVALAGVMGGASTEVSEKTKIVLLESAYFAPTSIAFTSRSLGLISESSIRFERGIDSNNAAYAANRAAQLMQEIASGSVYKGSVDVYPAAFKPKKIRLRPERANMIMGIELKEKEMKKTLSALELEVAVKEDSLQVSVPTFRPDLEREIDLIEEIGRMYDLNKIESTVPGASQVGGITDMEDIEQKIRNQLSAQGLSEAITYSFIEPSALGHLPEQEREAVQIMNPLSEEQSVLRTLLLPGLLRSLLYNTARKQENTFLFEIGRVFKRKKGASQENNHLGFILSGNWDLNNWYSSGRVVDFYDAKGLVESILRSFKIPEKITLKSYKNKMFHPLKSFKMFLGQDELGFIGEVPPDFMMENDLLSTAYAELDLDVIIKNRRLEVPFKGISLHPGISLDVALLVDTAVRHQDIVKAIEKVGPSLLTGITLFDIYEGKGIKEGKKSMAYSLGYQSMERTLELTEVQKIHSKVLENLKKELDATIR